MFIDVSEIRKSPGQTFHFDFSEQIGSLPVDNDEIVFSLPVAISLDIKNSGRVLVFTAGVNCETELICSRCLEKYPYHLNFDFEERFCHVSDVSAVQDEGLDTGDMHIFEANRIDLDEVVAENILLTIPMKLVCSQHCQGLCSVCGQNLNKEQCDCKVDDTDPRLGALKKFFEQ